MGSIYRVPFYCRCLDGHHRFIAGKGVAVYAAHLDDSVDCDVPDYTQPTAFLIGNEGNGLRRETAQRAAQYIKIPMAGQVEVAQRRDGVSSTDVRGSEAAAYQDENLKIHQAGFTKKYYIIIERKEAVRDENRFYRTGKYGVSDDWRNAGYRDIYARSDHRLCQDAGDGRQSGRTVWHRRWNRQHRDGRTGRCADSCRQASILPEVISGD